MTRFRTQYDENYKSEVFAQEVGEDEGLVQQHMRDECDVNVIMARYMATGELTHVSALAGEFGDYSDVLDYKGGLAQIEAADALFMELPAKVRDRFKNDPAAFLEFAMDEQNLGEMREMGLAPKVQSEPEHASSEASKGGARTPSSGGEADASKAPKKSEG